MSEQTNMRFPHLSFVGIEGVLVRFAAHMGEKANLAALAFHQHISKLELVGVLETAPSLTAVFIKLDIETDMPATLARIQTELAARDWLDVARPQARKWIIPCSFDGPQLGEAATLAGVSQSEAIAQITQTQTRVLTLGFAPGQPYLGTLGSHWDIPRMTQIAAQVPARALVVAVQQLIIFANEAPTGWRHIGQTAFKCFDKDRAEPFALKAGDVVQFERAGRAEIDALQGEALGGARLEGAA